jgi:hypothetical protein
MNEISTPRRGPAKRLLFFGGLTAAALAGGVATALAVASSGGTPGPGPGPGPGTQPLGRERVSLMAASQVLIKASDAAAAQPDLRPKPGQYLYFTSKSHQGAITGQPAISTVRKVWLSVDGKNAGLLDQREDGNRMYVWLCSQPNGADKGGTVDLAHPPAGCQNQPAYETTIPTDPKTAKAWLYNNSHGDNPPDVQAFHTVGDTIRERYIGSKALAALFKAAAQIPGVKLYQNVTDLAGRTGIAVGQTWKGARQELIFDPKTFKLIGEQEVCDTDTSFHPAGGSKTMAPAGGPHCKNSLPGYSSAELGFGVVDRPGERP